ncbi:MAG TPA: DUF4157 domain-containing protein [Flavipsychrobacter sp.]|nr:DUF4157 domain-containing protein [Flavipsychrobacter sp.]
MPERATDKTRSKNRFRKQPEQGSLTKQELTGSVLTSGTMGAQAIAAPRHKPIPFYFNTLPLGVTRVVSQAITTNETYEQEADKVAEHISTAPSVMSQNHLPPAPVLHESSEQEQKQVNNPDATETAEKKQLGAINPYDPNKGGAACILPESTYNVLQSPGQTMDEPVRKKMQAYFGFDFSNVRIHDDTKANNAATDVNAHAFTVKNHITFGKGEYQPNTYAGQKLLAHELTHVLQQRSSAGFIQRKGKDKDATVPLSAMSAEFIPTANRTINLSGVNFTLSAEAQYAPGKKTPQLLRVVLKNLLKENYNEDIVEPVTALISQKEFIKIGDFADQDNSYSGEKFQDIFISIDVFRKIVEYLRTQNLKVAFTDEEIAKLNKALMNWSLWIEFQKMSVSEDMKLPSWLGKDFFDYLVGTYPDLLASYTEKMALYKNDKNEFTKSDLKDAISEIFFTLYNIIMPLDAIRKDTTLAESPDTQLAYTSMWHLSNDKKKVKAPTYIQSFKAITAFMDFAKLKPQQLMDAETSASERQTLLKQFQNDSRFKDANLAILPPFHSLIYSVDLNPDHTTITSAKNSFKMVVNFDAMHGSAIHGVTIAMKMDMYFSWNVYAMPSALSSLKGQKGYEPHTSKEDEAMGPDGMVKATDEFVKNAPDNLGSSVYSTSPDEDDEEIRVKMSQFSLGDYVVVGKAAPKYRKDLNWAQHPSVAGFPFFVKTVEEIAKASTFADVNQLDALKERAKNAEPEEKAALDEQIKALETRENSGMVDLASKDLAETRKILDMANRLKEFINTDREKNLSSKGDSTTDPFILRLKKQDVNLYQLMMMIGERFDLRRYSETKAVDEFITLVTKQADELTRLQKRSVAGEKSFKTGEDSHRLVATLVKEDDGNLLPILSMVGMHPDADREKGVYKMKLVDVTFDAPDRDDMIYSGDTYIVGPMTDELLRWLMQTGDNWGDITSVATHEEAERRAMQSVIAEFGHYNKYGEGKINYRVPKNGLAGTVPSDTTLFEYLEMAVAVIGLLVLIAGVIASAGTLTPAAAAVVTYLGISVAVIGALMSIHNINERKEKGTLELDLKTALDIVNIVAGAVVGIGQVARITIAASRVSAAAKVLMLQRMEKALFIYDAVDFGTNVILISAKVKSDIDAIKALKLPPGQEDDMIAAVAYEALQQGAMMSVSLHGMGKQTLDFYRDKVANAGYDSWVERGWISINQDGQHQLSDSAPPFLRDAVQASRSLPDADTRAESLRMKVIYEEMDSIKTLDEEGSLTLTERGEIIYCGQNCDTLRARYSDTLLDNPQLHKQLGDIEIKSKEAATTKNKELGKEALAEAQSLEAVLKLAVTSGAAPPAGTRVKDIDSPSSKALPPDIRKKIRDEEEAVILDVLKDYTDWKHLVLSLKNDKKAQDAVVTFRKKMADEFSTRYPGEEKGDASKYPESDIDYNLTGEDAGKNLIALEAEMKQRYGENWSKIFRLNFYTDGKRLTAAYDAPGNKTPELEKELTDLTRIFSLAKMLQHARGNSSSETRVRDYITQYAKDQLPEIERLAALSPETMRTRRDEMHLEVDRLVKELSELNSKDLMDIRSPEAHQERINNLSTEITKKQVEINFYTDEAYIGPGALQTSIGTPLSNDQRLQAIFSNLEMMEHIIKLSGHDLTKAWKEYELFKYMYRISVAIDKPQKDLFFDVLNKQLATIDREGAKKMSEGQLKGLYDSFMNLVHREIADLSDTPVASQPTPPSNGNNGPAPSPRIYKPGDSDFFKTLDIGETRMYEDLDKNLGKATRVDRDRHEIETELRFDVATRGDFQTEALPRSEGLPSGENGFEALHAIGPLLGHESPYGILFAPFKLNRHLQEHGIESFISDFGRPDQGITFNLKVSVERYLGDKYPGVEFLNDVRYEIIAIGAGVDEPTVIFRTEILVNEPDNPNSTFETGAFLAPDIDRYFTRQLPAQATAKTQKLRRTKGDVKQENGMEFIEGVKSMIAQLRKVPSTDKKRKAAAKHYILILQQSIGNGRPDFVTKDMIKNTKDDAQAVYTLFPELREIYKRIMKVKAK